MGGAHRQRFFFKTRRAVIVGQSQRADEMMGHALLLGGGGGGGADGQIAIELPRIDIDDGTMQKLSQAQAEFCFPHGGGAYEDKKCGRRCRHGHGESETGAVGDLETVEIDLVGIVRFDSKVFGKIRSPGAERAGHGVGVGNL